MITMRFNDWVLLIMLSLIWALSFFFMKVSVSELPVFTVVWIRVFLAALTLFVILWSLGYKIPGGITLWRDFFMLGLLNNLLPFSLLVWGMTEISSGLASILNATTPIFTIIIAHFLTTDERISRNKLFGVFLGLTGVILLIGIDALKGIDGGVWGMVACLGAALSYALALWFGKKLKKIGLPPTVGAFGQVTASSVLLFPLAILIDTPWILPLPGLNVILSLLGLGIVSTGLAYIIFFQILASAGATNTALVTLLIPVGAILLGWGFLDETLSPSHFAGMVLIGSGLISIDGRLLPGRLKS